jgi:glycosyltransferase involved in cell wall biosynthesis
VTGERAKVVHVVFAGERGGAERMLVDLASRPEASEADHAVALFTPSEDVRRFFAASGLRVHDRGAVKEAPLSYLRMSLGERDVAWVEGVLRAERADVAHLHTFQSHVVGTRAALRAGTPILRTEHDTRYFVDPSCVAFTRWSLARVDAVAACSAFVGAYVAKAAPRAAGKTVVVRNGVDADRFAPRPELAPEGGPVRWVVACRLELVKQVDKVIDAVARVPGVTLDVLGDGSERARLEARARSSGAAGRVRFHGHVDDPRGVVARGDAAVSGSRREALPLSVLEAMAMGKPVAAFGVGGIPEIVRDGATGWLARDGSVEALAQRLRDASRDRERLRAMGAEARRFVERSARVETMCRGYARVYGALRAARRISS